MWLSVVGLEYINLLLLLETSNNLLMFLLVVAFAVQFARDLRTEKV